MGCSLLAGMLAQVHVNSASAGGGRVALPHLCVEHQPDAAGPVAPLHLGFPRPSEWAGLEASWDFGGKTLPRGRLGWKAGAAQPTTVSHSLL